MLRWLCGPLCHQLPSRSFVIDGIPLPLCSRCTGLWLGMLLCALFALATRRLQRGSLPPRSVAALCLLLAAPLGVHVAGASLLRLWPQDGLIRFTTGQLAAVALYPLLAPALVRLLGVPATDAPVARHPAELLCGAALTAFVGTTLVATLPRSAPILALLSALGGLGTLTLVNYVAVRQIALSARPTAPVPLVLAGAGLLLLVEATAVMPLHAFINRHAALL